MSKNVSTDKNELDILDDLLNNEGDNDNDEGINPEDIKALQEQVAALEKEKNGLLADVKNERKKRQQASGEKDKLAQTVLSALDERKQTLDSIKGAVQPEPKSKGLPVQYNDDGEGFVDSNDIVQITKPYAQKISQLEAMIAQLSGQTQAQNQAQEIIESIVGKDETYQPAYSKYKSARKWANDKVVEFQKDNNIKGLIEPGQALDHIFDKDLEQEFADKFPGVDLEDIVMAETSTKAFEKTLKNLSRSKTIDLDDDGSRFKKVMKKPSGLSGAANESEGSALDRISELSSEDLMGLSDKQAQALLDAMLAEEKRDGIKFK